MERILADRMHYLCAKSGLISPLQAGFRKGRSIEDQILKIAVNRKRLPAQGQDALNSSSVGFQQGVRHSLEREDANEPTLQKHPTSLS